MTRIFIGFLIFIITSLVSTNFGVQGGGMYVVGGICALLFFYLTRKKKNKKISKEEKNRQEFEKAEQDFNRYMEEWADEYNKSLKNRR